MVKNNSNTSEQNNQSEEISIDLPEIDESFSVASTTKSEPPYNPYNPYDKQSSNDD
jgi:hypothetical protein